MSKGQHWQEFFSDPSQRWDNRFDKESPRSPHFRYKRTNETLWMKAELASMTKGRVQYGDGSDFLGVTPPSSMPMIQRDGRVGSGTSTVRIAFARGAREVVDKNSFDGCGDAIPLCKAGQLKKAVHNLNLQGTSAGSNTYLCLVQECIKLKDLQTGKQVHAHIIKSRFKPNIFLLNSLVKMYAKCGSLVDARHMFENMTERDVYTWTITITGYMNNGCGREAFEIYQRMIWEGVVPNTITFICVLKVCASLGALEKGKEVHAEIIKAGIVPDLILGTALATMYAKCGSIRDARQVFDNMAKRDVVSWNAMITGYTQHGCGREAIAMYGQMQQEGVRPDKVTAICVLNACASLAALEKGKEVHADIIKARILPDIILETALVDMYAKCGNMKDARRVFDTMAQQDVISWSAMIAGYSQHGYGREALEMYEQMIREGVRPNNVTFISVLNACANLAALEKGKEVHAEVMKAGIVKDIVLETAVVDMYAKCGSMKDAHQVFGNMAQQDVVSWSAMIAGYAQHGCGLEALEMYERMIQEGVRPNKVTFNCVLKSCASLRSLEKGKEVHAEVMRAGTVKDVILETAIVDMYAKCGSLKDARQVFGNMAKQDVVSWSAMIAGYVQHGCAMEAFEMYEQMVQEGVRPNKVTFSCILNACASMRSLEKGKEVHEAIIKAGIENNIVLETALVNMYATCGSIKDAQEAFDHMAKKNVVSWNVMMAVYAQHGRGREAFKMYEQMSWEGVTPDKVTFMCALNLCAASGALEKGREVHHNIIKAGIVKDVILETTLFNMYAKCGNMKEAHEVFNCMAEQDVVSWNAMITGYAQAGYGREAFEMYEQMIKEELMPDNVTFSSVLNACASLAALQKGREVHADINKAGIEQDIIVETALVDMYSKCGSMKDARQVFDNMADRNVVSWTAMIAGYGMHGRGKEALQLFGEMQQDGLKPNSITFVCVLSACSHVGLVDEGCHYFDSMCKDYGLTPTPEHFGCMVDLLGRAGRVDEAEEFMNKMPIQPGATVWGSLLGACRTHGNVEIAERAAKCLLKWHAQDAAAYMLLSDIYAAAGRWDDTAKVRKMMEDKGVRKEPGRSFIEVDSQVHTFVVEDKLHLEER